MLKSLLAGCLLVLGLLLPALILRAGELELSGIHEVDGLNPFRLMPGA